VTVAAYDFRNGVMSLAPQFEKAGIVLFNGKRGMGSPSGAWPALFESFFSQKTRILHAHDLGRSFTGVWQVFFAGRVRLIFTLHGSLPAQHSAGIGSISNVFCGFPIESLRSPRKLNPDSLNWVSALAGLN